MKLLSLADENYQGVKSFSMDPDGRNVDIFGDNGTGKSTIGNSLIWLLTGKPIEDIKGYSIKTHGPDMEDIHNIDHSVEGRFQLDDGKIVTFKKVVSEDWRKTRGSNESTFKGNVTAYYIDGVPAKESDYTMRLLGICDPEKMRMLMVPHYFAETLPWEPRRRTLIEMCGDINDADVIASSKELAELPACLSIPGTSGQSYTVDDYRKIAGAKKSDINSELKSIPARVDEAKRAIPEITPEDRAFLSANIGELQTGKYLKQAQADKLRRGEGDMALREAHEAIDQQIGAGRRAYADRAAEAAKKVEAQRQAIRDKIYELTGQRQDAQNAAQQARISASNLSRQRDGLISDFKVIRSQLEHTTEMYKSKEAEQYHGEENCPTCGRPLPSEQIQEAQEAWNLQKSEALEKLNDQIKDFESRLSDINARGQACSDKKIAVEEARAKEADADVSRLNGLIAEHQATLSSIALASLPPYESTEEYKSLAAQRAALDGRAEANSPAITAQIEALEAEAAAYTVQINGYTDAKAKVDLAERQQKRITELEADEKRLAAEFEHYEKGLYLCDLFIRTKVSMLDERINSHFRTVRFKLFDTQINGGLKECCEVMVPSPDGNLVPFREANNGARINAGLELIGALGEHWGVHMPVVVDNAESVTSLIPIEAQIIRLVVSEADKLLRVEVK